MKVLITGASGAIGLEAVRQFQAKGQLANISVFARDSKKNRKLFREFGDQLNVIYGDITDAEATKKAVNGHDLVIHLAALIPTVEDSNDAWVHQVNVGGTENVVRAMEELTPDALLLFSSSVAIYGDRLKDPYIKVGDPLMGQEYDNYSKTKVEAEEIIENSKLNWSIFRLSAIMGIGNHKLNKLMFEVPVDTPMEITTVRDTARAFVHAIEREDQLKHKTFNLGGGEKCRVTFGEFMERAFNAFGMGKFNFPRYTFAEKNFHCGYYADGDDLEEILKFRTDDMDSYFERFDASVPKVQRALTRPVAGPVKFFLAKISEPRKAYKRGDKKMMEYYFEMED
jgi:nucleoside-diphosphate-sugar epimerase